MQALAQLGGLAMSGLLASDYFVATYPVVDLMKNPFPEATKGAKVAEPTTKSVKPINHKVGSYSQSKWLIDSPALEVRLAGLVDLETEVEVI